MDIQLVRNWSSIAVVGSVRVGAFRRADVLVFGWRGWFVVRCLGVLGGWRLGCGSMALVFAKRRTRLALWNM